MSPDEQPTILTPPPNGSRPASAGWQAPSVEEMQAMLPQYEVIDILGRGGMGAVYKARQKSLKRLVAIKILPLGMADDEMKFVERFQNEAQTMAAMNHPAIVSVYDFGETANGLLYFIMEYVDGSDVHKLIQASGKLSGEYALAITAHVCDALDYAHKRGVIHRDIKPANILIDQEGHIKVADFGLAKMDDPSQTSGLTKTNMAMGTPDYVAPEVLSPGMVADHRADLYAVGVMLYQMLTGEVPRGMFKLPSQKGIGSDPRFDQIICKAMEQDLEERYQSAMDVRRALDVILTTPQPKDDGTGIVSASQIPQKPVAKQPRPPSERSQPPEQKPAPQRGAEKKPADKSVRAPVRKSSAPSTWLSIGGIVAVLGVAAFLVLGGKPKPQASATTGSASATAPSAKPQPPIKVSENPKPTAAATSASAKGKEIDLLALVDVKRDAVAGQWVRTADGLVKTGGVGGGPRLQLPYQPAEEYDFEIEFTPTGGIGNIGQILAAQGREFGWMLNTGDQGNHRAGFGLLDGKRSTEPTETTASLKEGIVDGRRYRSRVEVRAGRLCAFLDDAEIVNWIGDFSRLGNEVTGKLHDSGHIGLRLNRDAVFHKITVREVSGVGKVDAGTATTSFSATLKTIDLLPLVDVKRDMIGGEWSREGGDLLVKAAKPNANGSPRLQLPYQPPEEYDFEIEFTPESGPRAVYQILSAYQRSFSWLLDSQLTAGNKAGFDTLDGVSMSNRTDGTTMRPKFLTNGQRHRSTVEVRRNRVRALLDGEPLVTWGSSPKSYERLDISKNEKLRDALHLGLAAYDRAVRFHKITVREVTGTGKVDANTASVAVPAKQFDPVTKINWLDTAIWEKPWVLERGALKSTVRDGMTPLGTISDGTIRVRLRDAGTPITSHAPALQLTVRFTQFATDKWGHYLLQIYPQTSTCNLVYLERNLTTGKEATETFWKNRPLPAALAGGQELEFEFRAEADTLSVSAAGQSVASIRDARLSKGTINILANPTIEITRLETVGVTNSNLVAASNMPPPDITNWQDVTETVREKARAVPGLVVESGGVRRPEDAPNATIQLMETEVGDRAVRVRYVGQVQVSLWFKGGAGSAYALAQRDRMIFKRISDSAGTVNLRPMVPHPAGFDPDQPHELLLTVQGPMMRVWLDGLLVGDVQDDIFTNSTTALVFIPSSTVHKVEVAHLDAPPGTNEVWTDWLGPKLASGKSPNPDWRLEKDGVTTDKVMGGVSVLSKNVHDAAVRVTCDLHDFRGVQITMRERITRPDRELYVAHATGTSLDIGRMQPGGKVTPLARHPNPLGISQSGSCTLEFRCVGDRLEATLTGATTEPITVTATDATLTAGPCAVVLQKGTLLKKVETMLIDGASVVATWQTFQGHRYQLVSGNFNWQEAKAEAEKLGGHLAIITSAEENDWAWKTFSAQLPPQPKENIWKRGWWLGASQTAAEKPWSWLTDEPLGYECWGVKEPSTSISPPRYLWMADANKDEGTSNWSAQNGWIRGGVLVEWDRTGG